MRGSHDAEERSAAGNGTAPGAGAALRARSGGHTPPPDTAPTGLPLVIAFAAVAITFTAALVIAERLVMRIRTASNEITSNNAPSVSALSSMRGELRLLEVRLDEQVSACQAAGQCARGLQAVTELREQLGVEWITYRGLPAGPEERQFWVEVDRWLDAVEAAATEIQGALALRRTAAASELLERRLKPACDQLDEAVARVTAFNHDEGLAIAADIDALARRSVRLAVVLGALSLAFTAVAAALSIRSVHRSQALLRRRADELDQFAGRVAHDVLSPLSSTALALRLVRNGAGDDALRLLERGERGLWQVQETVQALLAFARASARPAPGATADVAEVLHRVVEGARPAAEAKGVAVSVELQPARVACDAGVLVSVAANLVQNAIKHMGARAVRQVHVRARPERDRVRIEVEDSGPGIPAGLGARVFEPFVRAPDVTEPGSGLGLATARRLVVAHGGEIGFSSRSGEGTVFWFELPRAPFNC